MLAATPDPTAELFNKSSAKKEQIAADLRQKQERQGEKNPSIFEERDRKAQQDVPDDDPFVSLTMFGVKGRLPDKSESFYDAIAEEATRDKEGGRESEFDSYMDARSSAGMDD